MKEGIVTDDNRNKDNDSMQLYTYTLKVFVPCSLSRNELNEITTFIKCLFPDAKVEVV